MFKMAVEWLRRTFVEKTSLKCSRMVTKIIGKRDEFKRELKDNKDCF